MSLVHNLLGFMACGYPHSTKRLDAMAVAMCNVTFHLNLPLPTEGLYKVPTVYLEEYQGITEFFVFNEDHLVHITVKPDRDVVFPTTVTKRIPYYIDATNAERFIHSQWHLMVEGDGTSTEGISLELTYFEQGRWLWEQRLSQTTRSFLDVRYDMDGKNELRFGVDVPLDPEFDYED